MLRTMLNAHPELAMPRETRFMIGVWQRRAEFGSLENAAHRRRLAKYVARRKASRARRLGEPDRLFKAMVAAPPTLGSVLEAAYEVYAARDGKRRWGDKRPAYVLHLGALLRMFPDAQFINLVRDPRATVASIARTGWSEDGVVAGVDLWDRSVRAGETWRRRLPADRFLDVRYEDLVAEPAAALERLLAFLSLDPAGIEPMLAFYEQRDVPKHKLHPLVSQPVTTSRVRAWESSLEPADIAFVESTVGASMRRYGYEPVAGGAGVRRDFRWRLLKRRATVHRELASRWVVERKVDLTYRAPVAAVGHE